MNRMLAGICLAVCAIAAVHCARLPRLIVDDAFISYRYAAHWVAGDGLVFNPGERVEGFSNFLWVVLTAVGMKVGADPIAWTRTLGALSVLGIVAASAWITYRVTGRLITAAACGFVLALSTALTSSALSGLETGLYGFFVVLTVAAFARQAWIWASLWIGLAALTRPEGAGLCVVAAVCVFLTRPRTRWGDVARLVCPCAVMVAGLLIFRVCYYGALMPNSVQAKSAMGVLLRNSAIWEWPGLLLNGDGIRYVSDFIQYAFGPAALVALLPAVLAIGWPGRARRTSRNACTTQHRDSHSIALADIENATRRVKQDASLELFMTATVLMGFAVSVYNFGDWMSSFRLLTPYLSVLSVLMILGLHHLVEWAETRTAVAGRCAWMLMLGLSLWFAARQFQPILPAAAGSPDLELAAVLRESRQPGLLATTDVLGRLGYYAPNVPIVDMAGLTDRHIARNGEPRPPFGKNDFAYVLSRRPHFIMNNVRTAWLRHLDKAAFTQDYLWVDRAAWTLPTAARGKPRYVFVRRDSLFEAEILARFPDARLRPVMDIAQPDLSDPLVASGHASRQ